MTSIDSQAGEGKKKMQLSESQSGPLQRAVLIGATPHGQLQVLLSQLAPDDWSEVELLETWSGEANVESAIPLYGRLDENQLGQELVVLCVGCPRIGVTTAMSEGVLPSAAIADWLSSARLILAESNEGRVRLVDLDIALRYPHSFARELSLLNSEQPEYESSEVHADGILGRQSVAIDQQLHLIADSAVSQHPEVDAIYSQLRERMQPMPDVPPVETPQQIVDVDAEFLRYQSLTNQARRFREQEPVWANTTEQLREIMKLRREVHEKETALLRAEAGELLSENDRLSQQLETERRTLQRLRSSTSWRITKPLRMLASFAYRVTGRNQK